MKKLKIRFPISIQISIFLIIAVFVPVAAMMMLKTYESQMLAMIENSNVQQARILSASLSSSEFINQNTLDEAFAQNILQKMNGNFDSRIRILDYEGKLLADSSRLDKTKEDFEKQNSRNASAYEKTSKAKKNESFIYRLFSIPVRVYRKLKPPAAVYSNADYYSLKTVYDGEEIKAAMQGRYGAKTRISSGGQVSVTLYSAVPVLKDEKVIGIVLVSRSTWRILQNLYELRTDLAKVFLWSLLVVIVIAFFLGFRISLPLKKLARQTTECADKKGRINTEKLNQFAGQKRKDEIGDLSRSFKTLINKLDSKIKFTQAFASDVNHEFKNPLAAIRSSCDLLKQDLSKQEREQFCAAITEEITHLEQLLTGVRNISKIDGSGAEMETELIPLVDFTNNIVSRIKKNYPNTQFDTAILGNNPKINFNPDFFERLLTNLIDNAASFANHVQITIGIIQAPGTKKQFKLFVCDNGKGIEEAEAQKIFNRFYSNRAQTDSGHTGLGLSIVKAIVDESEGEIKVSKSSTLGGACFEVTIPLK